MYIWTIETYKVCSKNVSGTASPPSPPDPVPPFDDRCLRSRDDVEPARRLRGNGQRENFTVVAGTRMKPVDWSR